MAGSQPGFCLLGANRACRATKKRGTMSGDGEPRWDSSWGHSQLWVPPPPGGIGTLMAP